MPISRGLLDLRDAQRNQPTVACLLVDEHRPHETLAGKTPNEVHFLRSSANEQPRIEPRRKWPPGSPCAQPQLEIKGRPGDSSILEIDCHEERRHLLVIRIRHAA